MFQSLLLPLGAAATLGLGALAYQGTAATDRPDCPGRITCPQSGEVICADQCPLDEQQAPAVFPCCRD